MPKRNAKADEAYALYQQGYKLIEIAKQLDVPDGTVRRWKHDHKWESERSEKKKANVRKKGAQQGNHNASGPPGNQNAAKFGFLTKWLPEETRLIFEATGQMDPLDMLWHQIQIAYAAILRAQQIAYVKDKNDKTIERVAEQDGNVIGEKWEVQQAWDKQENFLKAQSVAQNNLARMIKQYDEMLHNNWDTASEEQKARIAQIRANTERLKKDDNATTGERVVIVNDIPRPEPNKAD